MIGRESVTGETLIDPPGQSMHPASKVWYSSSAERVGAAIWMKVKRPTSSGCSSSIRSTAMKPLQNPLGVVHPVNTDPQQMIRGSPSSARISLRVCSTGGASPCQGGGHWIEIG